MSKEEKYRLALNTIYRTLKERFFQLSVSDKAIIRSILQYIETVEKFIDD